jgi:tetratricopeptide (TPR) repeat protein
MKNKQNYVEKFGKKAVEDKLLESFSAIYRSTPEKYESLKTVDSVLFVMHKRMVRFSTANSKFLKDKTDRDNWNEMLQSAADYIQHNDVKANQLNSIAWTICENYKIFKDKAALKKALEWSKSSLADEPENPSFIDTYAHLLAEKGDKKNAIIYQERAIRIAKDTKSTDVKELEDALKKFQGKK